MELENNNNFKAVINWIFSIVGSQLIFRCTEKINVIFILKSSFLTVLQFAFHAACRYMSFIVLRKTSLLFSFSS